MTSIKKIKDWLPNLSIWFFIWSVLFLGQIKMSVAFALIDSIMVIVFQIIIFHTNTKWHKERVWNNNLYRIKTVVLIFFTVVLSLSIEYFLDATQHFSFPDIGEDWYVMFSIVNFSAFYISPFLVSEFLIVQGNLKQKALENTQLEKAKTQSQLEFLRSQIDSHFLFNSLNSIYTLSYLNDNRAASKIMQLSDMLRYVLYESDDKVVKLSTEIEYLQAYIDLHNLRCKREQAVDFTIKGDYDKLKVTPMIFQPFLENAYKHSHIARDSSAFIKIRLCVEDEVIDFAVFNSKPKEKLSQTTYTNNGIGMTNVKKRLELEYSHKHSLKIVETDDDYRINLTICLT